ncbi:hypothetical protein [Companilactobacillus paralimentarius]|uniref:hypothetical protein n=1 Tax=Companilactobacillus paralimentarius TaxID=83526 RepID=UPI001D04C49E|nr:hypothetical protein [Companilactobacillus paralimentarius]
MELVKCSFDRNNLWGGTCPNRGCDPKKVLLSAVEARDRMTQLKGKGFGDVPYVNWEELEKFKATFTDPVSAGSKKEPSMLVLQLSMAHLNLSQKKN